MKAILEFDLPEEQAEHETALNGNKYKIILAELDNWLRGIAKYQDIQEVKVTSVREKIFRLAEEYDIKDIHG
jgi:hypothetical protein